MDEEARRADRSLDEQAWKKIASRAPVEWLRAQEDELAAQHAWWKFKVKALTEVAPRCHCGEIGEPYCPKHVHCMEKLEAARLVYEGPLHTLGDAVKYMQAWMDAGKPGWVEGKCSFQPCKEETGHDAYDGGFFLYCDVHSDSLRGVSDKPNKSKGRSSC